MLRNGEAQTAGAVGPKKPELKEPELGGWGGRAHSTAPKIIDSMVDCSRERLGHPPKKERNKIHSTFAYLTGSEKH